MTKTDLEVKIAVAALEAARARLDGLLLAERDMRRVNDVNAAILLIQDAVDLLTNKSQKVVDFEIKSE